VCETVLCTYSVTAYIQIKCLYRYPLGN